MPRAETTKAKPRAKFCWVCGNKLRLPYFTEKEIDGHSRVLHKACAEDLNLHRTPIFYSSECQRDEEE